MKQVFCKIFDSIGDLTYKSPDLPASTNTTAINNDDQNKPEEEDDALVGFQIQPTVPDNNQV